MKKKKTYFRFCAISICFLFLICGAGCKKQKPQEEVLFSESPVEKSNVQEKIDPLKLVYELKNFGPSGSNGVSHMTLWIEGKQDCGGREAYVGLMQMESGGQNPSPVFSKITIFSDNGEMAVSRFEDEDKLVFDDMPSEYNQINIPLTLNSVFEYAGKNFQDSDVWNATTPILLKKVDSGMSITDYSIMREKEQTTGILPCQNFKIVAKGTNMDGTMHTCVAKEMNDIKLPFVVSFAFGDSDQQGPRWQLTDFSKETSGIVFVPQCMESVVCTYLKEPDESERNACAIQGGEIQQQRTEQGCVMEYKCLTQEGMIRESVAHMQRPGCSVDQAVEDKLLSCRKNNQPNFDVTNYDQNGCATDASCRP